MTLPFSPTFFRKIDIFQQLMEYEAQKDKKHLWEGEKTLLFWAGSEHHQHIGSAIDINHVKDALKYGVKEAFISEEDRVRMEGSARHILEGLPTHEFGKVSDITNPKNPMIKINRNGVLAGQILKETKNLKDNYRYKRWSWDWHLLYFLAGLLLIAQFTKVIIDMYRLFIK